MTNDLGTTLCRCWRITRADGVRLGFTDHDRSLSFDGTVFSAVDGLSAGVLEQTTGLAVDNAEALGVLSDDGIRASDIAAGLFDGAAVEAWEADWSDVARRRLLFRGEIGEIERAGMAFRAELRGLSERLNRPQGRLYQSLCPAVLGDDRCGVDLADPAFHCMGEVLSHEGRRLRIGLPEGYADGWFVRGWVTFDSGETCAVRGDDGSAPRDITLWEAPRGEVGTHVRLVAGCDKRAATCAGKFDNLLNFRGFPHMPSEDWLMAYPVPGDSA